MLADFRTVLFAFVFGTKGAFLSRGSIVQIMQKRPFFVLIKAVWASISAGCFWRNRQANCTNATAAHSSKQLECSGYHQQAAAKEVMCAHLQPMEKPADCSSYQAKKQVRALRLDLTRTDLLLGFVGICMLDLDISAQACTSYQNCRIQELGRVDGWS